MLYRRNSGGNNGRAASPYGQDSECEERNIVSITACTANVNTEKPRDAPILVLEDGTAVNATGELSFGCTRIFFYSNYFQITDQKSENVFTFHGNRVPRGGTRRYKAIFSLIKNIVEDVREKYSYFIR